MAQYPLSFDTPESLDRYLASLRLQMRRQMADSDGKPDLTPLDPQERQVYDILSRKIAIHLAQKTTDNRQKAEDILKQAKEGLGERELLNSWLSAPLVMGVPYIWFVVNALICLTAFILTQNFVFVFFAAPAVHAVGYLYFTPRVKREREENIQKILGHG